MRRRGFSGTFAGIGAIGAFALLVACSSDTFVTNINVPTPDGGATTDGGPSGSNEGSVCGDTSNDPLHCGACNHSCLGGLCTGGRCMAMTLATSGDLPSSLALDGSKLYAGLQGGNGGVLECPLAGCPAGTTAKLTGFLASGLAVDKDAIYVAHLQAMGKVFRSPKGSGSKAPFTDGDLSALIRIASDGIYIANDGSGTSTASLTRFDASSKLVTLARTTTPIRGIAFTTDRVMWTQPGAQLVYSAKRDGTTPVDIPEVFLPSEGASGAGALGIAVVGSRVFIAGQVQGTLLRCAIGATCSNPESIAVGGAPSLLEGDEAAQKLYWYDTSTNAVRACDVGACEKTKTDLVMGIPGVFALAVGADAVYFTVRSTTLGGVYRIAK